MDWLPQWLLVNLLFLAAIVLIARVVWRAKRRQVEALAEQLRPDASARGWQVATEYERNSTRVIRWSGRDAGVEWVGEDIYRRRTQSRSRQILEVTRWRTANGRGTSGAVFLMPLAEGTAVPKVESTDGLLQSLLAKAAFLALDKAMDLYFGDELGQKVDAGSLKRVEEAEALLNGYVVFAEVPHEATRVVRAGVDRALRDTVDAAAEPMRGIKRPWVLIGPHGVALGRMAPTRSAAELEPMVAAGLAITRALSRF